MKRNVVVEDGLVLRVLMSADAEGLFALVDDNREHLRKWLPWVDETTHRAVSRRFIEQLSAAFDNRQSLHYGIFAQDRLVGMVGFHAFDWSNKLTSLGYWLSAAACGQGIMRKSVSVCVGEAFRLGINRISIRCAVGNERSRRIPQALGFKAEGVQREAELVNGRYVDLEVFSLLRSEWPNHFDAT